MGLEKEVLSRVLTTRLDFALKWARKNSVWPMPMGISCCAIEMMATAAARWDISRFGSEVFRFSPRQADLMLTAGTLVHKMAPVVKRIYDQMPEPKWVVAMGTCLCTGGMFHSYSTVQGLDEILPVDVYIPGCPPRPENVLGALQHIQRLIGGDTLPNKSRAQHEADWQLSDLFYDKLSRIHAGRNGRVARTGSKILDVSQTLDESGNLVPSRTPMGIPLKQFQGGSVDIAGNRYGFKVPGSENQG